MIRASIAMLLTTLTTAFACSSAWTQSLPVVMEVDIENFVEYLSDASDPAAYGKNPNRVPATLPYLPFGVATVYADIVAVNGQPAKGTVIARARGVSASPTPATGEGIADVTRVSIREQVFEILKPDGTPIGSIMAFGLNGGPAPPGSPPAQSTANMTIVGGTGAYLGVRGQYGRAATPDGVPVRPASMAEDPSQRRKNGGGKGRFLLTILPWIVPQISTTGDRPSILHASDSSLVTASKPARPGEVLILIASGLGPTRPATQPGQPFPASPPAVVNSPLEVKLDGKPVEVLSAAGVSGAVDSYRVRFQLPSDAPRGQSSIQISAAWITSSAVRLEVR